MFPKPNIFLILTVLLSTSLFAEVDELQSELLSKYLTPFRWDVVSDKEYWVKGNKPTYDFNFEFLVLLKLNESSLPRTLKIVNPTVLT